ncbi:MAG: hypothetical protein ACHQT5_01050 [Candidatus Saccharimonadales bacterium]
MNGGSSKALASAQLYADSPHHTVAMDLHELYQKMHVELFPRRVIENI